MATNFPTSLDSLTNPTLTDGLNSPSHADQHADANDAIEALQAKVGVNGSAVTTSLDYKVTNGIHSSLNVDSGTLVVDATNNRVGVNTASPAYALDVTGTVQATQFIQGTDYLTPYTGFRNAIINGDFRINQRAWSSSTATASYGFDRWRVFNVGGTVTMSSQSFTVGSPAATGYESPNFVRIVTASQSASGDYAVLQQPIEDARAFANSTVTISFWAKAASGTPKVAVELAQVFGTGGSPSADVNTLGGQVTLSTSWVRYSVTMTVPNVNGKTFGTTANTSSLNCNLWVSAGSNRDARLNNLGIQNNTFDFWGIQVERGSVATPFEQRPIGAELALCQRYYWFIAPPSSGYGKPASGLVPNATTVQACGPIWHPVTMRSAPTIGFTFSSNNMTAYDGAEVNATAFADASPWTTTNLTTFNLTTNSGLTANRTAHILHRVGNITFSSEF